MRNIYIHNAAEAALEKQAAVVFAAEQNGLEGLTKFDIDIVGLELGLKALKRWGTNSDLVEVAINHLEDLDTVKYIQDIEEIIEYTGNGTASNHMLYHNAYGDFARTLAACWILENDAEPIAKDEWLESERFEKVMAKARKLYRGIAGHPYNGGTHKECGIIKFDAEIQKYTGGFFTLFGKLDAGTDSYTVLNNPGIFHRDDILKHIDAFAEQVKAMLRKKLRVPAACKIVEQVED
jgi:hypothetical protein